MLTREENELLTQVGPGTPGGELLRRYWHPVAVLQELTAEQPTKLVRLLGEDLVLFRDRSGRVGLLADHCAHRGASLLYGRVEERGIACAYHGWLYDVQGNCLETPAEPTDSKLHLTVRQRAYPVRKFLGMYWAYLGPAPAPEIPPYDIWVRADGRRKIQVHPRIDCNWFQASENSVDPAHLQILHQELTGRGRTPPSTTRGYTDDIESFDFYLFPHGIIKKRTYKNGVVDEHPLLFPTVLRVNNSTEIRVPIDDTHMTIFEPYFYPAEEPLGAAPAEKTSASEAQISLPAVGPADIEQPDQLPVEYIRPFKDPVDALHPFTRFRWDEVAAQDTAAWETQGPIADREHERLATSDRGVVLLRQVMKENIERVRQGLDPLGVIRDPSAPMIDTKLDETLEHMRRRGMRTQMAELVAG